MHKMISTAVDGPCAGAGGNNLNKMISIAVELMIHAGCNCGNNEASTIEPQVIRCR